MTAPLPRAERILVIKHGAFGDAIQVEGALRDIRNHHAVAEIALLTTPPYKAIFVRCPWVDRIVIDPRHPRWRLDKMLALRTRLKAERFDRIYDLQNSTRTGAYRRWIFAGLPWSGEPQTRDWLLRIRPQPLPSIERLVVQLRQAGVPIHHTGRPDVSWMADDVSELLKAAGVTPPFVVLVPGSSAGHPEKRWPFYPVLARKLRDRGITAVMAPGPDESALAKTIPAIDLTAQQGLLSWFQLAGVLSRAAFVVGNDTGPSHLAAHLDVPGLGLFGPHAAPEQTGIRRERFDAIAVSDLQDLGVDRVLAHVLQHLERQA